MSPCLNYQIARAHQAEIARRAQQAQRDRVLSDTVDRPRRSVRSRIGQAVAMVAVPAPSLGRGAGR